MGATTLWRPTGPEELALVEASGWVAWPPRLPEQPIFYPVLNEDYAVRIARDWNVPASGVGYVTRFEVERSKPQCCHTCGLVPSLSSPSSRASSFPVFMLAA
jgi:hypothetical protein